MNLKALLAKVDKGEKLSVDEIKFLLANDDSLSPEQKAKVATMNQEDLDEDQLKSLIGKHTKEAFEQRLNGAADNMVDKFLKGIAAAHDKKEVLTEKQINSNKKTVEFFKALTSGDKEKLKALSTSKEDSDTAKGGYTIPVELSREVLRIVGTYGVSRRLMRYIPFTGAGNTRQLPKISANPTAYWTDEKQSKRSSEPAFGLVEQTLKKLACIIPWSDEFAEDTGIDLNGLLAELIAEAMAKGEDEAFLVGTGSPFTGVLNNGSVQFVTMASGEDPDELVADYLLDMQDKVPTSMDAGAGYVLSRSMLSVIRKLKDGEDRYIFQEPSAAAPGTIWGKPYTLSDVMPAATATGNSLPFLIYGDLKKTCILGDKQSIQAKLLDQATITDSDGETELNLAEQDMSALRFVERVGFVFALPEAVAVLRTHAGS